MFAIMDVIKGIRMNEWTLFGRKSRCNNEFLNDGRTDWRKLMYHIVSQLWTKVIIRSDHKSENTCLMIDDTDFPKTGRRMENIGRVPLPSCSPHHHLPSVPDVHAALRTAADTAALKVEHRLRLPGYSCL